MSVELTDLERDALAELVNMGVGRAAASLSRLLEDQVLLSVPKVEVMPILTAADLLSLREAVDLVAIGQSFTGSFSGQALLIFPEARSFDLVRAMMNVQAAPSIADIADIEQEALTEIGNIILNGCLAVIANTLKQGLKISMPTVLRGDGRRILLAEREPRADEMVLFLYIDFAVRSRNLNGYIALLMDIPSLTELRALIREFIENLSG